MVIVKVNLLNYVAAFAELIKKFVVQVSANLDKQGTTATSTGTGTAAVLQAVKS